MAAEQSGAEQQPTKNGRSLCALAAAAAGAEVGNYSHEIDVRRIEVEGERDDASSDGWMSGLEFRKMSQADNYWRISRSDYHANQGTEGGDAWMIYYKSNLVCIIIS